MSDENDIASLKKRLAAAEAVVIGQQIDAALATVGIAQSFRVAARALWLERRPVLIDAEAFVADRPLAEAVKAWAATDEGRALTTAPAGAKPPKGGKGAPARRRSEMKAAEKGAYIAEHGLAAYEALPR